MEKKIYKRFYTLISYWCLVSYQLFRSVTFLSYILEKKNINEKKLHQKAEMFLFRGNEWYLIAVF